MKHAELRRLYLFVFAVHLGLLWWLPFFPSLGHASVPLTG